MCLHFQVKFLFIQLSKGGRVFQFLGFKIKNGKAFFEKVIKM